MHLHQQTTRQHQSLYTSILFFLMLLLVSSGTSAQLNTGYKQPYQQISTIEFPVRLSLEPLAEAAEKALPRQAGNWRSWKDWHGIKSQYRAWRGPLSITATGDVLLVQAHIRYWIKARKKVLGAVNIKGSCGVNEPPRQAVIGMQVRMGWGPEWTIRPEFHILPTRFLDRCEMTIANIDVTPLVEREFRKQMQESLRAALRTHAPNMDKVRKDARRTWLLLQEPVELGANYRLMLKPLGVALSGINGKGNTVDVRLAITFLPIFKSGTEPFGKPTQLPQLERFYPRSTGLNLRLNANLDFADLSKRLSGILAGQHFDIHGQQVSISSLTLSGEGHEIMARIELLGEVAGTLDLRAKLLFIKDKQRLDLQDLTFHYDANNPALELLEKNFHEPIRQVLEDAINKSLRRYLSLLGERIEATLEKAMPAGIVLDVSSLQLRDLHIQFSVQGIALHGSSTGSVHVTLR